MDLSTADSQAPQWPSWVASATEMLSPLEGPLIQELRACALDQSLAESVQAI
jgi:hypothetical protein